MKIKCLSNTGAALMDYPRRPLSISKDTRYGLLEAGKEYTVMGIILFEDQLCYLIDDDIISSCPNQLFEITDSRLPPNWYFKALTSKNIMFPYIEALWGYYELCFIEEHYQQLLEVEKEAYRIYYKRKKEMEEGLLSLGPANLEGI